MFNNSMQSNIAAFFATLWGKIIAALAVVSMLLGIYVEMQTAQKLSVEQCAERRKLLIGTMPMGLSDAPNWKDWKKRDDEWKKSCL